MNRPSDSNPPTQVSAGNITAGHDVVVAGKIGVLIVQNIQRAQKSPVPRQPEPPPLPPEDPRVHLTLAALAHIRRPQTCTYLGRRYGLTPQAPAPGLLEGVELGAEPPPVDSLAQAMNWLAGQMGMKAAQHLLAERYSRLDDVAPGVGEELATLARLAAGRVLVTGSYSARIHRALGPALTVIHGDRQADGRLTPGLTRRAHLLMLHGSEQDFQNALVAEDDVATYSEHRPALTAVVSDLLASYPWIVLGAERRTDSTFHLQLRNVCRKLEMEQRPVFVVDPRCEEEVASEWPRAALRHVRLTPAQFLSLARAGDDA